MIAAGPQVDRKLRMSSVLPAACAAGVVFSWFLVEAHTLGDYSRCTFGEQLSCKAVVQSPYSYFLGAPLAQWGLAFYVVLLLCFVLFRVLPPASLDKVEDSFLVLALWSVLLSLYLAIISKFVIKSFCPFCIALYVVNVVLLVLALRRGRGRKLFFRMRQGVFVLASLPLTLYRAAAAGGVPRRQALAGVLVCVAAVLSAACTPLTIGALFDARDRVLPEAELELRLGPGVDEDYHRGRPDAPVRLVIFSDIQCPVCRRLHQGIHGLPEELMRDVLFVYKNYPIDNRCNPNVPRPFHLNACQAALFARCAGEQGRFWPVLDRLYSLPEFEQDGSRIGAQQAFTNLIAALNLDDEAMQQCMASERYLAQLQRDIQLGDKLGLRGTPMVFINGREVSLPSIENIERILRRARGRQKH